MITNPFRISGPKTLANQLHYVISGKKKGTCLPVRKLKMIPLSLLKVSFLRVE